MTEVVVQPRTLTQGGLTNPPILVRSPVKRINGHTAKPSCMLNTTWLAMSSRVVCPSPQMAMMATAGTMAMPRVTSRRSHRGRCRLDLVGSSWRAGAVLGYRWAHPEMPPVADTSLFAAGPWRAVRLGEQDLPALQAFLEQNPAYFLATNGCPPPPDAAWQEMHEPLPAGWSPAKRWLLGFLDPLGSLVGMATVVGDAPAPGVWHLGLLIVATRLHGAGAAPLLYGGIERWAASHGAHWLRLGVIRGNARAEAFWVRRGFTEVRTLTGVRMGTLIHTIRVMVKPSASAPSLADYLATVPDDDRAAPTAADA